MLQRHSFLTIGGQKAFKTPLILLIIDASKKHLTKTSKTVKYNF